MSIGVSQVALLILPGHSHMVGGWLAVTWSRLAGTAQLSCTWPLIYRRLVWACFMWLELRERE